MSLQTAIVTMQNRIIEWFREDQFASANLNRLELFEIKGKRTLALRGSYELPSQVSCISCSESRDIVAVGQQSGNVSFVDGDTSAGVKLCCIWSEETVIRATISNGALNFYQIGRAHV